MCGENLYDMSKKMGFQKYIIISNHIEEKCSGRDNANILDLYSGIGSFGIECISRGAKKVTFIDKDKDATKHFPAEGEGTLSGIIIDASEKTGLANQVYRLILGGSLKR